MPINNIISEQESMKECSEWTNREWYEYLFQNGLMNIGTFRQRCYDIVDEMIERKYGKREQS